MKRKHSVFFLLLTASILLAFAVQPRSKAAALSEEDSPGPDSLILISLWFILLCPILFPKQSAIIWKTCQCKADSSS